MEASGNSFQISSCFAIQSHLMEWAVPYLTPRQLQALQVGWDQLSLMAQKAEPNPNFFDQVHAIISDSLDNIDVKEAQRAYESSLRVRYVKEEPQTFDMIKVWVRAERTEGARNPNVTLFAMLGTKLASAPIASSIWMATLVRSNVYVLADNVLLDNDSPLTKLFSFVSDGIRRGGRDPFDVVKYDPSGSFWVRSRRIANLADVIHKAVKPMMNDGDALQIVFSRLEDPTVSVSDDTKFLRIRVSHRRKSENYEEKLTVFHFGEFGKLLELPWADLMPNLEGDEKKKEEKEEEEEEKKRCPQTVLDAVTCCFGGCQKLLDVVKSCFGCGNEDDKRILLHKGAERKKQPTSRRARRTGPNKTSKKIMAKRSKRTKRLRRPHPARRSRAYRQTPSAPAAI